MQESKVTGQLAMQWIPVVGSDGRTHMEARWQVVGEPTAIATPHAA
jgi:hypothetical protein